MKINRYNDDVYNNNKLHRQQYILIFRHLNTCVYDITNLNHILNNIESLILLFLPFSFCIGH